MEPDDVAEYSKQGYWDARYEKEDHYDWFQSVYDASVERIRKLILEIAAERLADKRHSEEANSDVTSTGTGISTPATTSTTLDVAVRVLHLGTGNSKLPFALAQHFSAPVALTPSSSSDFSPLSSPGDCGAAAAAATASDAAAGGAAEQQLVVQVTLYQCCMDYSPVVVQRMASHEHSERHKKTIDWQVGDIRKLSRDLVVPRTWPARPVASPAETTDRPPLAGYYDLIIDKGTMDALQADKSNDCLDEDLEAMLHEVSLLLTNRNGRFVQVTWETPYYRLHHTKRSEYGWVHPDEPNAGIRKEALSEMYYFFVYEKR